METLRYELADDGIATLTFDAPGSPVNTMTPAVAARPAAPPRRRSSSTRSAIRGVLLASAKSTFFAGAALKTRAELQPEDAPRVFAEIERSSELPHARDARQAGRRAPHRHRRSAAAGRSRWSATRASRSTIRRSSFGMPEVTLGLIPGASGITKTSRRWA